MGSCDLSHDLYRWEFIDHDSHVCYVIKRDGTDPPGGYDEHWLERARELHAHLSAILDRHRRVITFDSGVW